MAQHFQATYIDDIDGADLGQNANTLVFAFDGKEYSIDLSDDNADTFRKVMDPYITAGRRVTGKSKNTRKPAGSTSSSRTKAVRDWARNNGYEVSDRGRIPADVMQAYTAAN